MAAAPAPMKTRKPVPRNSAASFCQVVGGAAMRVARGTPVTKPEGPGLLTSSGERRRNRNMFDIAEQRFTKHKLRGRTPSRGPGSLLSQRGDDWSWQRQDREEPAGRAVVVVDAVAGEDQ